MIISAHQPAYLPWAGYLHRIALSDQFILLDDLQFEKNSYINRNAIKSSSGSQWLTVPVKMKGHIKSKIIDLEISNQKDWKKKHLRTIYQAYSKSQYFLNHAEFIDDLYSRSWTNLNDLNLFILENLLIKFNVDTPIVYSSEMQLSGKKQNLILEICKKTGANSFIFGGFGRDYVDIELFSNSNIKPYFHEYQTEPYYQRWGEFIPNLSIIDMLFNVDPDNLKPLLLSGGILNE